MNTRRAALGPVHVQPTVGEVDRIPPQRHKLGHPKGVPKGDQDHGGIPMAVAIATGRSDQPDDLGISQIFPDADLSVAPARRGLVGYCPIYSAWYDQRESWFFHGFLGLF